MPEPTTITDASGFIRRGELTPVELLEQCLARIDRYEDRVRAWVYLDRDGAREQAERLTAELKRGENRGPLHGIPTGIKDIIDVFDMPTGCGSKLWANSYARRDATVVERLRQAGAVILGKTVTTAFASFDPPVTRNPWNLERTPGGSSSGSAAAVACGMCLGALASQTGGSITRPASYCGVCGLKPTYGRVSVDGVLPLAPSMDHVGAMANCVRDLAILFQAIAGPDSRDGLQFFRHEPVYDCTRTIDEYLNPAGRPRVPELAALAGLFAELATLDVLGPFRAACDGLRADGAEVEHSVPPADFADVIRRHRVIMAVEAAEYHGERLRRHPEDYPPRVRALIEEGLRCSAVEYRQCRLHRDDVEEQINRLTDRRRFLLTPATTSPPLDAATTGDPAFNSPWSYTGQPTVSLPFTRTAEGLPLCLQLVGYNNSEDELLAAAAWCERAIGFDR